MELRSSLESHLWTSFNKEIILTANLKGNHMQTKGHQPNVNAINSGIGGTRELKRVTRK